MQHAAPHWASYASPLLLLLLVLRCQALLILQLLPTAQHQAAAAAPLCCAICQPCNCQLRWLPLYLQH
jgi:hypothetical protein